MKKAMNLEANKGRYLGWFEEREERASSSVQRHGFECDGNIHKDTDRFIMEGRVVKQVPKDVHCGPRPVKLKN